MGTPSPERALDPVSGFDREPQHFGVELYGSVELVRDDFDVVDPLEHHGLPTFVDRALPVSNQRSDAPCMPFS